jgi:hypothetical protein
MSLADLWPGQEQQMQRAAAAAAAATARHHALNWLDLSDCYPRRRITTRDDDEVKGVTEQRQPQLSRFEAALLQLIREETASSSLRPRPLPARLLALDRPRPPSGPAAPAAAVTLDSLPHGVRSVFSARGIISLWEWQASLLSNVHVVRDSRNALVCLPSGSGKSVAADLLLLRAVLQKGRSALLALPYQSGVHEKVQTYEAMVLRADLWVECHDALSAFPQLPLRPTLCVCT